MKTLEFNYQDNQINFLVNQKDKSVMINATEMAKMFGKRTTHYLENESTKEFISALKLTGMSVSLDSEIMEFKGRNGLYFCELLAIDFAAWLNVDFKIWIYSKIQEIIFGNYRKHWEAHAREESLRIELNERKQQILLNPTAESVASYFELERSISDARQDKSKAIRNQLKLFSDMKQD